MPSSAIHPKLPVRLLFHTLCLCHDLFLFPLSWTGFCSLALPLLVFQAIFAATRSSRVYESPQFSSKNRTERPYDLSAMTHLTLHLENVVVLSLFAEYVLPTKSLNLVLVTPFPTPAGIALQSCLLLNKNLPCLDLRVSHEVASGRAKHHEHNAATTLAAEYMITKATLDLVLLEIGAIALSGVSMQTLHFVSIVLWNGLRQWRVSGMEGLRRKVWSKSNVALVSSKEGCIHRLDGLDGETLKRYIKESIVSTYSLKLTKTHLKQIKSYQKVRIARNQL